MTDKLGVGIALGLVALTGCVGSESSASVAVDAGKDAAADSAVAVDDAGTDAAEPVDALATDAAPHEGAAEAMAPETGPAYDAAPVCEPSGDLSGLDNVGTADFHISFMLSTTMLSGSASNSYSLVNQFNTSDDSVPYWDMVVNGTGYVSAGTCAGPSSCESVTATTPVNDGQPHQIVLARVAGSIFIMVDGAVASPMVPDGYSFGMFEQPLTIDMPPGLSFAGHGMLTNLCITLS